MNESLFQGGYPVTVFQLSQVIYLSPSNVAFIDYKKDIATRTLFFEQIGSNMESQALRVPDTYFFFLGKSKKYLIKVVPICVKATSR